MEYGKVIENKLNKVIREYKWGYVVDIELLYRLLSKEGYHLNRKQLWRYVVKSFRPKGRFKILKHMHSNARMKLYYINAELFEMAKEYLPHKAVVVAEI